jgi:hypothetical protein
MLNRSVLWFWVQGSKFTTGTKSHTILIEIRNTRHIRLGETSLNDETICVLNTNFIKPIVSRFQDSIVPIMSEAHHFLLRVIPSDESVYVNL